MEQSSNRGDSRDQSSDTSQILNRHGGGVLERCVQRAAIAVPGSSDVGILLTRRQRFQRHVVRLDGSFIVLLK